MTPKWISCRERLPAPGERVLVYFHRKEQIKIDEYYRLQRRFGLEELYGGKPSHWMPLPEPPAAGTGGGADGET